MFGILFLIILVVIAVVLIGMYNSLVQLRVRCDSAWSDIDVQLKRRHDLITTPCNQCDPVWCKIFFCWEAFQPCARCSQSLLLCFSW
jgi:hypothetical protein